MQKKFQILLSLSVLTITVVGLFLGIAVFNKEMYREMINDVAEDNKFIGKEIVRIIRDLNIMTNEEDKLVAALQNICEETHLPNDGFICAANMDGDLVAIPQRVSGGEKMNILNQPLKTISGNDTINFYDLGKTDEFTGMIESPNGDYDIVYSLPVEGTGMRILVHQNRVSIQKTAEKHMKQIRLWGLVVSIFISVMVYVVTDRIISRYQFKVEKLNLKLQTKNRELEIIGNQRKELIHVLSHDLANPLGSILTGTELMDVSEENREFVDIIKSSAENGLGIINFIRQILALEDGKLDVNIENISLNEAISISEQMLYRKLHDKKIKLVKEVPAKLYVRAEKYSFSNSVINNLLTNAIKYSSPGAVIYIKAEVKDNKVRLSVKDSGIGIPDEILDNLFDLSKKTNRLGTEGEHGTGFGMPLVKKFVEHYNGSVSIKTKTKDESPEGHGTEIIITLEKAEV